MRKVKVKLNKDEIFTWGVYLKCCNKPNFMSAHNIDEGEFFYCEVCEKPLAVMGTNGKMYHVGESVFDY